MKYQSVIFGLLAAATSLAHASSRLRPGERLFHDIGCLGKTGELDDFQTRNACLLFAMSINCQGGNNCKTKKYDTRLVCHSDSGMRVEDMEAFCNKGGGTGVYVIWDS